MAELPCLCFCPYLRMRDPIEFGPWWLGSIEDFGGPWTSAAFERAARRFVSSFVGPTGDPLGYRTILACRDTGVDGAAPEEQEQMVLEAVLHFATIDANPDWREDDYNLGWSIATSDNSDLFVWPIDVEEGRVATQRGAIVCVQAGGARFTNPGFEMRSPLELPTPSFASRLDAEVADACYGSLTAKETPLGAVSPRRLRLGIGWLAKAWRNSRSIAWEDRVVMLKVAFEVLLKSSKRWLGAVRLRRLFERTIGTSETRKELLWSPHETERHTAEYTAPGGERRTAAITDLQHWFMRFGQARNEIVHEGSTELWSYEEENTYKGHLFWVAERVLREALKVSFSDYGFPHAWRSSGSRGWMRAVEETARRVVGSAEEE